MRGLRSFGVLLVVARALGAYCVLRRVASAPPATDAEKKDKAFAVEADKIEEFTVKSESGEQHDASARPAPTGRSSQPARAKPDAGGSVRHHVEPGDRSRFSASSTRTRPTSADYSLAQPRIEVAFKAAGKDHKLRDRPQDSARQRSLRPHRRPEARGADPVVRRHDLQSQDLRPARQGGADGQPRRDRLARRHHAGERR